MKLPVLYALSLAVLAAGPASAALTDLANVPLASASPSSVKPNVMFILDDSGSMSFTHMPDTAENFLGANYNVGGRSQYYYRYGYGSSQCNGLAYDRTVTYLPPLDAAGSPYPSMPFSRALANGFDSGSATVNLENGFRINRYDPANANSNYNDTLAPAAAAYYYLYTGTVTKKNYVDTNSTFYKECITPITGSNSPLFTKITVGTSSGINGADERQNFANWYSFYRTRMLSMKTAASRAFISLGSNYRVGFMSINNNTRADYLGLSAFSAGQKSSWYAKLTAATPSGATPLRSALSTAGLLYAGKLNGASFNGSRVVDPIQYSCQQNFAILSTDGYWNTGNDSGCSNQNGAGCTLARNVAVGDRDSATSIAPPMFDALKKANTLADVAMYYATEDLRTPELGNCTGAADGSGTSVCENNVPGTSTDSNTRQHMTSFTLGLGVSGTLQYSDDYLSGGATDFNGIIQGTKKWPDPLASEGPARIDDLWHAAVNGRGTYFNASSPDALYNGLTRALAGVSARTGSSSAAATSNLEPVAGDNFVYSALYRTVNWDGDLQAKTINPLTGEISTQAIWSAQALLDSKVGASTDSRTIYTFDSASASRLKPFTWDALSTAERAFFTGICASNLLSQCPSLTSANQSAVSGANLVNFLRGQKGLENVESNTTQLYRSREHTLGDIISSQPVYVKVPPFQYADVNYAAFRDRNTSRAASVYVASNDGMLHAFDGDTGMERWAYVPPMVLPNLFRLADQNYAANHRYFVDGSPTLADICPNAPASTCAAGEWKSILIGGLNGGGRGYYALDVTDPARPKALWNFAASTGQSQDLGYTYGNPIVTKRKDGTWVVVFSSGYNNVSPGDGRGYLYVLNANTGALLQKIGTGAGDVFTPSNLGKLNAWIPSPTSNAAERFYGGDMQGNLWRFDIDDTTPPAGNEALLLAQLGQVRGAGIQPITTKPELTDVVAGGRHYTVINVGTGRYLGNSDLADDGVQSVYAIKDSLSATSLGVVRASDAMVQRTLSAQADAMTRTVTNATVAMDWTTKSGWYVDLASAGERVNVDMQQQLGILTVVGNMPSSDACTLGGYAWLYNFDYRTGLFVPGATNNTVGIRLGSNALVAGVRMTRLTTGKTVTIVTDTGGGITIAENPTSNGASRAARRISWRELVN